jgi:hypothetical protein
MDAAIADRGLRNDKSATPVPQQNSGRPSYGDQISALSNEFMLMPGHVG